MNLLRPSAALLLLLIAGCAGGEPAPPSASVSTPIPSTASATASPAASAGRMLPAGYLPLWPFADLKQVQAWQAAYRDGGHSPWHLEVEQTALSFAQDYLGFDGIDRVTSRTIKPGEAHIGVGYRGEGTRDSTAAVIHLFRVGTGKDAPWEVVGTDDTHFTLTTPPYGSKARSPMTVGGRITGVDENIQVRIVHLSKGRLLPRHCCLAAGGEKSPWSLKVSFRPAPGTLTVAVWTGGHLAEVERFAVTGVRG